MEIAAEVVEAPEFAGVWSFAALAAERAVVFENTLDGTTYTYNSLLDGRVLGDAEITEQMAPPLPTRLERKTGRVSLDNRPEGNEKSLSRLMQEGKRLHWAPLYAQDALDDPDGYVKDIARISVDRVTRELEEDIIGRPSRPVETTALAS